MFLKAYRLAAEDNMMRSKIFKVGAGTPEPRVSLPVSPLIRAYETPELAAYCCPEWLANDKRKTVVVRETISLPEGFGLHDTMVVDKPWLLGDEDYLVTQMTSYIHLYKLLSVWALSYQAPQQHVVLINTQHPAYPQVQIASRRITTKKSAGVMQSEDAIPEK